MYNKISKQPLKKFAVWLLVFATIVWSIGLPVTIFVSPAKAVGPTIIKVEKVNPQAVDVVFDQDVQNATVEGNYAFSGGLNVVDVMQQSANLYRVIADGTVNAGVTTLTVSSNITNAGLEANTDTGAKTITEENRIKISEVFTGLSGATTKEFVELYNAGPTSVNLSGYKLHIRSADGLTDTNKALSFTNTSIPAFSYFLIASSEYNDIGVTPDATYSAAANDLINNGSVYISTSDTANTNVIDKIGWGSQASGGYEGTAATSTPANQSLERKSFGNSTTTDLASGGKDAGMGNGWDSGNNSFDFALRTTPQPQNTSITEQPDFNNYSGTAGSGPMIMHMPVNRAPSGGNLELIAQMGDPQTAISQIIAKLYFVAGDGTPANNVIGDYTAVVGVHQSNGYFKFTIPQAAVDASTANGLYYFLKITTNSGTKYMSASLSADNGGVEGTIAQNPFIITVQNSAGWTKHNITGTIKNQANANVSGALVFLEGTGYSATTAGDGTFTLANVKDAMYNNLIIIKDGYYDGWFSNLYLNGATYSLGNFTINSGTGGGVSGDSTKPTVKWTGPNDGMLGVPPRQENFKVFIGFSKDMDSATINNTNIFLTTDGSTASSSAVTYDNTPADNAAQGYPQDSSLGIVNSPAGGFMPNTTYYLVMTGGVRDTSGNALSGNRPQGGHVISFTTGGNFASFNWEGGGTSSGGFTFGAGDMKPPYVLGTTPIDGTMNVVPNTKININFSDPMDSASVSTAGNIKVYKVTFSGGAETLTPVTISSSLDTSQKIAIIAPGTNLTAGRYRIIVTGALKSGMGIFMGNPGASQNTNTFEVYRSHFEVGANSAVDNTKPTILGTWPVNNDTNIAVNPGSLTIQFSENMDPTTINSNTITLKRGTTLITGNVTYDAMARSANFSPSIVLNTTTSYSLTVVGSATATSTSVTDIVGNPMAQNYAVSFTTGSTGDTDAPKIMFANGDDFGLAITFNESMNSAKITDTADNWSKSVLNSSNFVLKYGTPGTDTAGWTAIDLTSSSFKYDGMSNTLLIENIGIAPELVSGKDFYLDLSASSATDLSGNLISASSSNVFQGPIQSSATTKGMLGPMTGGGMSGGMMGPNMSTMGMMKAGVFPMNALAGMTTLYFVDLPVSQVVASNYKIVLTFPQGFDVSSAKKDPNSPVNSDINEWGAGTIAFGSAVESSGGASNDGVTVDATARTVTITMSVTGTPPSTDFLHLDLAGIKNSSIPRSFDTSGYTVDMKVLDASGNLKETISTMPFFINAGGSSSLSGNITFSGVSTEDGTLNLYLGSPMTGPIDQAVTITNGQGSYSFPSLPNGTYMLFTDPVLTLSATSTEWAGMTMPETITVSGDNTKNLTFAKQNSGAVLNLTVNLSGAFGSGDIDVFAGSPNGFRVKTITNPGTDPSAVNLYLPQGDWMVGVGPAMPKGPMAGPPPMPDWMPPMPQLVKSSGTGSSAITLSISSANMNIVGYVTDGVATSSYANGTPIADAEVYAYQPGKMTGMGAHTKTDVNGKFTLKIADTGNYSVGVFKPGLPNSPERSVVVNADTDTGATDGNSTADIKVDNKLITASDKLFFKLKKSSLTISGKVTDGTNPVAYAPVWAYQNSGYGHADTMTDSSGNYILYVDSGTWVVNSYIPNYGDAESQTVAVSDTSATQNLAPASGVSTYTISGTISIGGVAQANMPIRAVEFNAQGVYQGKEYFGSTDSSGAYSISVAGTGQGGQYKYYRVDIWTPTYGEVGLSFDEIANSPANIRIANTGTTTADILIDNSNLVTATLTFSNKAGYVGKEAFVNIDGATCSGSVCKPSDFHKNIRINDLSGTDSTTQLKANGKYFISVDIPGIGKFIPDLNANMGRDTTTGSVIATTTARAVKFTLPDTSTTLSTITGTVRDGSSNALANAWVWIGKPSTGFSVGTSTIANGTYTISVPAGTGYKMSAEKSGYLSNEPADLNASANASKDFTLAANTLTISGRIYADANSNSSYDSGEETSNGWVRAETTDASKKTYTPTDSNGYFELGVVNGTWTIYGVADGYSESSYGSNISISGSSATGKNIKLTTNDNWSNKSTKKPIIPASGGTLDDTDASGTGVKLTVPPNALGQSASTGNLTAAVTGAVVDTNSNEVFGNEGTRITATDNSSQAITNLNDYIDMEKVIYKSEVADEISAGNITYAKLKTMENGYWDSTSNDWVTMSTIKKAYFKTSSEDTEWTLYSDPSADDDFSAFIDTLIAGTSYTDYKLVFTSKTNHFTVFAVIFPFVAAAAAPTPVVQSSPAGSSGGAAPLATTYCSEVTYSEWQICSNSYQYRNVLAKSPANCTLTAQQEAQRKILCSQNKTNIPQIIKENVGKITKKTTSLVSKTAEKITAITIDAKEIIKGNIKTLLQKLGIKRSLAKEKKNVNTVSKLVKNTKVTATDKHALTNFVTYGTDTTKQLTTDERTRVLNAYKQVYKKLPKTEAEWSDALRIANGLEPLTPNELALKQAKKEFKKVYKREAVMDNDRDKTAVNMIAYGLKPTEKKEANEKAAIKTFKNVYGHSPISALAWSVVRAIAYSGASR